MKIEEFIVWALAHTSFQTLCDTYLASGKDGGLVPSVNRLDDTIGYEYSNMEFIAWEDHLKYTSKAYLSGHTKHPKSKQVCRLDIYLKKVEVYASASAASRDGYGRACNISFVCNGQRAKAKKTRFCYLDDYREDMYLVNLGTMSVLNIHC